MGKIIKGILLIITLISLYIIFSVGLGWFWTIGNSPNAEKINTILVNLSYSYIAGFVFYILISYLPYRLKAERLKPVINQKISRLYNQIEACVQTFNQELDSNALKTITLEELTEKIKNNGMYGCSFFSSKSGVQFNNLSYLKSRKVFILDAICFLLEYKEYMSTEQILYIERIRDSDFFYFIDFPEGTEITKFYSSDEVKEIISKKLYEMIESVKYLKKSI